MSANFKGGYVSYFVHTRLIGGNMKSHNKAYIYMHSTHVATYVALRTWVSTYQDLAVYASIIIVQIFQNTHTYVCSYILCNQLHLQL